MNNEYDNEITKEQHRGQIAVAVLNQDKSRKNNNEVIVHEYTNSDIQEMIHEIRGQQVMLDSDLALLYNYEVKRLNEQVKRNINRFPVDFMFQLTREELEFMKSQFATSPNTLFKGQVGGVRKLPYAFTEQGVNQLSAVLKGPIAEKQSVLIMRTFVRMRHYLVENKQLLNSRDILKIENRLYDNEQAICRIENTMATKDDIQNIMDNFIVSDKIKEFGFLEGKRFEADELFINLYSKAKHSIYMIHNYISIKTLSHLKHKRDNVDVIIFTKNAGGRDKLRKTEFDDFNAQYPSLVLKNNPLSHDRYIILDYNTESEKIYHSGASIKDAGQKVCSVNEISDKQLYHNMIDDLLLENDIVLS